MFRSIVVLFFRIKIHLEDECIKKTAVRNSNVTSGFSPEKFHRY